MKKICVTRLMGLVVIMTANTVFAGVSITSVGTDNMACDHATIQGAINAVGDSDFHINVTTEQAYHESLLIDKGNNFTGIIQGGFADCTEAEANLATSEKTTISGDTDKDTFGDSRVMKIIAEGGYIELKNLTLTNGLADGMDDSGGGLGIFGDTLFYTTILLSNVNIHDNKATNGGGVYVGGSKRVTLEIGDSSFITENEASISGGGIYCSRAYITTAYNSGISDNRATQLGGGAYMNLFCNINVTAGGTDLINKRGIVDNIAGSNGGGVYISQADLELIGSPGNEVSVLNNTSLNGSGGAFYLSDGTSSNFNELTIENAIIDGNKANDNGGMLFAKEQSTFNIRNSVIKNNRADQGAVAYIGFGAQNSEEGFVGNLNYNIIANNGDGGSGDFSDEGIVNVDSDYAELNIIHNTIVDNKYTAEVFISPENDFFSINLYNSIIANPDSGDAFSVSENFADNVNVSCSMFEQAVPAYFGDDLFVDTPNFIDRPNNDYRLDEQFSNAIDKCANQSPYTTDIAGVATGFDEPDVVNEAGTYDIGAYELFNTDIIFTDGFEAL